MEVPPQSTDMVRQFVIENVKRTRSSDGFFLACRFSEELCTFSVYFRVPSSKSLCSGFCLRNEFENLSFFLLRPQNLIPCYHIQVIKPNFHFIIPIKHP